MNKSSPGFTIIELLFVLGIIALIMAIVIPSFKGMQDESNAVKAKTELSILQTALESYFSEKNMYPALDYQSALIYQPVNKIINKHYIDPFNSKQEYDYYSSPDNKYYLIRSLGYNRQPDIDFLADIDPLAGTVVTANCDDFFVTNLKEK